MRFLAVYIGSEDSPSAKKWEAMDDATRSAKEREGIEAWGNWVAKHSEAIVYDGAPLGPTLKVDPKGIQKGKNALTAFTVVEADSAETAAKLFLNHPHFSVFPGESVEIVECLPIPGP